MLGALTVGPLVNQKVFYIQLVATYYMRQQPSNMCLIIIQMMSTGVRQTLVGSQATPTLFMAHLLMLQPLLL